MAARKAQDFEGLRVSSEDWPIVLIEFPEDRVNDAALHAMFHHVEELMREAEATREKLFVITDLTRMSHLAPASQRKYSGEWIQRTGMLARTATVGGAQVTPSSILRGLVTAIFWLKPPPTPAIFVATREEAIARGIEMLTAAQAPLSPRVLELREATRRRR
ncbi:MAG TPA: hypothetical protein VIF09_00020 [Polyangiaceae bacterium]|jgi:hypothetical protein